MGVSTILYQAFGEKTNINKNISTTTQYEKIISKDFPSIALLKNGDLLFRRGYGVDSTISMNFSQGEKRYSHAGIIQKTDNGIFIIHAEEDKEHGYNGVYNEPIREFLEGIHIWAVYRFDLSLTLQEDVINYALKLKGQNITFDMNFNLKDDSKMYCSEFIYKVINRTTQKELISAKKYFLGKRFVTLSDLYENGNSQLVELSHSILKKPIR
jgi:hypothetical protein